MSEPTPVKPQLTFRDEDVKNLRNFLEFVRDHATFKMDMEDSILLGRYVAWMQQHIKRVHDHVMELVQVIEPVAKQPAKSSKAKAE
jgi:hypothetical protein